MVILLNCLVWVDLYKDLKLNIIYKSNKHYANIYVGSFYAKANYCYCHPKFTRLWR